MKQLETSTHIFTFYEDGRLEILFKASGYVHKIKIEGGKL